MFMFKIKSDVRDV